MPVKLESDLFNFECTTMERIGQQEFLNNQLIFILINEKQYMSLFLTNRRYMYEKNTKEIHSKYINYISVLEFTLSAWDRMACTMLNYIVQWHFKTHTPFHIFGLKLGLAIENQTQEFCIVMFRWKKLQIKQYKQASILRNGTKMPKHVIKVTSIKLPVIIFATYFSACSWSLDMSDLLFSESFRTWSSTTQRSQLKDGNKRNLFQEFVITMKSSLKYDAYCLIYEIFATNKNYEKYALKILAEIHSFTLHLSDIVPNQVAIGCDIRVIIMKYDKVLCCMFLFYFLDQAQNTCSLLTEELTKENVSAM